MKISQNLLITCVVLLVRQVSAQLDFGSPLANLPKLKDFQTLRASSSDPDWKNGNGDARPIEPGGTLTLATLEGPGQIVHIWCTIAHDDPFYSRLMTLRIYWDDEEHPSVECPIGDFRRKRGSPFPMTVINAAAPSTTISTGKNTLHCRRTVPTSMPCTARSTLV